MMVIGQIHKVRVDDASKVKAVVSIIVSDPDEIIRIPLFKIHQDKGLIEQLQKLQSKTVTLPVRPTIYNGSLNYNLSYGAQVKEYK